MAEENENEDYEENSFDDWSPRTKLGQKVKDGEVEDIDYILERGKKVMEEEIIDYLLPGLDSDLMNIGQAKGKFGGGQRRVFKQTNKKTSEGNSISFSACAVVGNHDGYVGIGHGKSADTVPARDKAIRKAKLNIKKIRRGCGSWRCGCATPHSIPYAVEGKCGSVRVILKPAPKGKGLVAHEEVQKILDLAGVEDVWSSTFGTTRTTNNVAFACIDALNKLVTMKTQSEHEEVLGMEEGPLQEVLE